MSKVTDLTKRLPFKPTESTEFIVQFLRQIADEIENGDCSQVDSCLIAVRNEQNTFLSRLSLLHDNEGNWISLANAIKQSTSDRLFK